MVKIVSYKPEYAHVFKTLNYQWIEQSFTVEESDKKFLEDPEGCIINEGGEILIALMDSSPVGTCALIKKDKNTFELAKMAVSEEARGNNIGQKLGEAIIEKAKKIGGKKLFLETNSILTPAISLYKKLGFKETCGVNSSYQRCNIQMELEI